MERRNFSFIVQFVDDPNEQRFEVFLIEDWPWIEIGEVWLFSVKWRSLVSKDISGEEMFDTQLFFDRYERRISQ